MATKQPISLTPISSYFDEIVSSLHLPCELINEHIMMDHILHMDDSIKHLKINKSDDSSIHVWFGYNIEHDKLITVFDVRVNDNSIEDGESFERYDVISTIDLIKTLVDESNDVALIEDKQKSFFNKLIQRIMNLT